MGRKKLTFAILDILRKYTDEDHRLSQKDIIDILETEYDLSADRKSVKRNITSLMDMGYDINFSEALRMFPNKEGVLEESYILSDFYLEREFEDSELRLLIDSLLFSKHIPYSQCKDLIHKLEGLPNQYFKTHVRFISTLPETAPKNPQLFYTIEVLDEAIAKGRQVAFTYNSYGTDKKLAAALSKGKTKSLTAAQGGREIKIRRLKKKTVYYIRWRPIRKYKGKTYQGIWKDAVKVRTK